VVNAGDDAITDANIEHNAGDCIMTTAHPDESLGEALRFFGNCAYPADDFAAMAPPRLVIAAGDGEALAAARVAHDGVSP
jgi:hypothetical protein